MSEKKDLMFLKRKDSSLRSERHEEIFDFFNNLFIQNAVELLNKTRS
jgi:hypothetical protein